jgi:hypothetical protein
VFGGETVATSLPEFLGKINIEKKKRNTEYGIPRRSGIKDICKCGATR